MRPKVSKKLSYLAVCFFLLVMITGIASVVAHAYVVSRTSKVVSVGKGNVRQRTVIQCPPVLSLPPENVKIGMRVSNLPEHHAKADTNIGYLTLYENMWYKPMFECGVGVWIAVELEDE